MTLPLPKFLMATCQVGAEPALKGEFARRWPAFRPAFARPGFVTFKLPEDHGLAPEAPLEAIFARALCFSLGTVEGETTEALVEGLWRLAEPWGCGGLHVWRRDPKAPGESGFEPGIDEEDVRIAKAIRAARPDLDLPTWLSPGTRVLDCVIVEPDQWRLGFHTAGPPATCWPGGFCGARLPPHAVSRAWLKMEEALRWSQLPLEPGQRVAELGSAPGGAAQALLDRGLLVTGIDPAEMDPAALAHPNFTHIRKRGADVRRREFRKIRWLTADMNVAPRYTLDTVEAIVTHPETRVRGLLLTLKLLDWALAEQIPEYLFRIRTWGYKQISARQLAHNRQEITVAARR